MTTPRPQVTDELLSAYLDGAVSPEERLLVEQALAADAAVAWRLDALLQTVSLVRALPQVALPKSFSLEAILAAERLVPAEPAVAPAGVLAPAAARPALAPARRAARAPWWERWGEFWNSGSLGLRNAATAAFALFLVVFAGALAWEPQSVLPANPATLTAPATVASDAPQVAALPAQAGTPAGTAAAPGPAAAKIAPEEPSATTAILGEGQAAEPEAAQMGAQQETGHAAAAAPAPEIAAQGGAAPTDLDRAMVESAPPGAEPGPLAGAVSPGMGGSPGAPGMGGGGDAGGAGGDSAGPVAGVAEAAEAAVLRAAQEPTLAPTATPTASPTATPVPTATPLPTPASVAAANPAVPAASAGSSASAPAPAATRTGFGLDWLTLAAVSLGGFSLLLFGLWLLSRMRSGAR